MNQTVTVPALSPAVDQCHKHAWVFGPSGFEAHHGAGNTSPQHDAEYMSEHRYGSSTRLDLGEASIDVHDCPWSTPLPRSERSTSGPDGNALRHQPIRHPATTNRNRELTRETDLGTFPTNRQIDSRCSRNVAIQDLTLEPRKDLAPTDERQQAITAYGVLDAVIA